MSIWAITTNHLEELLSLDSFSFTCLGILGLTGFIFILAILSEFFEFRDQERLFNKKPFSELGKFQFRSIDLFKDSLLKLFQVVFVAQINGYQIVARMNSKSSVSFSILTIKPVDTRYALPDGFKDSNLSSDSSGVVLVVSADSMWTPTIEQLGKLLQSITMTLMQHQYPPAKDFADFLKKVRTEVIMRAITMNG